MTTLKSISRHYRVPAQRGAQILFRGVPHVVVGAATYQMYLRVRPVAGGDIVTIHPTWEVVYLDATSPNTRQENDRG